MIWSETCPDCGCMNGRPHRDDCDIERCSICGMQRVTCGGCDGHDPMESAWIGTFPLAGRKSYHVIQEDADTRIHERNVDDPGEFETWREARDSAVAYLEAMIADCQARVDEMKASDYYAEYATK